MEYKTMEITIRFVDDKSRFYEENEVEENVAYCFAVSYISENVTKVIFEIYLFHYKTKYADNIMSLSEGNRDL